MRLTPDTVSIIIHNLYFGVDVVALKNMRQCLMTALHNNGNCMHRQCRLQTNWENKIDLVYNKYEEIKKCVQKNSESPVLDSVGGQYFVSNFVQGCVKCVLNTPKTY